MQHQSVNFVGPLALTLVAILAVACGKEEVREPQVRVQGGAPVVRDVDVTLRYPVELFAAEQVSVAPVAVSGFLTKVLVDVGDKVKSGELIATLDCREYAAQGAQVAKTISQRRAQLAEAKALLDRLLLMNEDQLIAPAELDRARAAYRVAEAQLAEAKARMSEVSQRQGYCSLKAPFDGYVSERLLDPGAMVAPGEKPVVTLVKTNDVTVIASVIEQDVAKIQRDAEVVIHLHAFPGQSFRGRIARIGRALDPSTRTLPIEMDIPNAADLFMPGMTGRVEIVVGTREDAVLLPVAALLNLEEGSYAFVARESDGKLRAERVEVTLGVDLGDWIEIREGVSAADRVIMVGRELVADGTWVELTEPRDLPALPAFLRRAEAELASQSAEDPAEGEGEESDDEETEAPDVPEGAPAVAGAPSAGTKKAKPADVKAGSSKQASPSRPKAQKAQQAKEPPAEPEASGEPAPRPEKKPEAASGDDDDGPR